MPVDHESQSVESFFGLLALAREGDPGAISALLESQHPQLRKVARFRVGACKLPGVDADDLVQETLLAASRRLAQLRGSTQREFFAWLRKILFRIINDLERTTGSRRNRHVERVIPLDEGMIAAAPELRRGPSACAAILERERVDFGRECLEMLPDSHQQVLRLYYDAELGYGEIGARLGRSADAARMLLGRALQAFGELVRDRGVIEDDTRSPERKYPARLKKEKKRIRF
jgi:RNA polymerase sigma-70 factor (ECF subfamily)